MNVPDSSTSANAAWRRGISGAYCALTSTSGICGCTTRQSRGPPAVPEIGGAEDEQPEHGVVHVVERVVEALPVRAERPPDAGEPEAPDGRAGNRQERVAAERHLEHPGRDRDERPKHRRDAAEGHDPVAPALERPLGSLELLRTEVEPAAVALDEGTAAVAPDRPAGDRAEDVPDRAGEADREPRPEPG